MKRFRRRCSVLALIVFSVVGPTARAQQTENFQDGFRIVTSENTRHPIYYYLRANGEAYSREEAPWQGSPLYVGNFFGGDPVPSDFLANLHAVRVVDASALYYVSSTGGIYKHIGTNAFSFGSPPDYVGNFFFDQPVPADFQKGIRFINEGPGSEVAVYYVSQNGDVYRQTNTFNTQAPWGAAPAYVGNFWGDQPVRATPSTLGSVKSKYR